MNIEVVCLGERRNSIEVGIEEVVRVFVIWSFLNAHHFAPTLTLNISLGTTRALKKF